MRCCFPFQPGHPTHMIYTYPLPQHPQMSLQQGCNTILRHDCVVLANRLYRCGAGPAREGAVWAAALLF
jgi:hypothetical protein